MVKEKPSVDYIYTFVLTNGKEASFIFKGYNEKGRVVLLNLKLKTTCTMTPDWFSYMATKRIIRKIKYDSGESDNYKILVPEEPTKDQEEKEFEETLNGLINELKSATDKEASEIYTRLKVTPKELIVQLLSNEPARTSPYLRCTQ